MRLDELGLKALAFRNLSLQGLAFCGRLRYNVATSVGRCDTMQTEAGIRELKTRLSAYLREVKAGGTVLITERGKPIGRIVPLAQSTEAQLEALRQAGMLSWSGEGLTPFAPAAAARGDRTVADLLLEGRD